MFDAACLRFVLFIFAEFFFFFFGYARWRVDICLMPPPIDASVTTFTINRATRY